MIKLIDGTWSYGQTVIIEADGKRMKRKVKYGTLDGLYIIYRGEKIGYGTLTSYISETEEN